MKKEELKIRKEKLQKQHEDWIKKKAILNALKELNKLSIDQNQKDIIKQKQVWEEAGEQYGKELGSEIAEQLKLKEEAIKTESRKVKQFEQHLTDKIQVKEDMSISKNVKKFFEDIKSLDDVMNMPNINLNHSQLTRFVPGKIVQSLFGSIQNKNKDKIIRIKAIKEYITELCLVTNILQCYEREAKDTRGTNNTFWINDYQLDTMQKITLQPESTNKVLSQINEFAYDSVLTRNGDLLISDQTSSLRILKGTKGSDSF
ncbi:unnamed protein product [Mytilus edulis]|uniref:Uncharacterized protein n=1 Tax=Mytilus edulis TaxID=6550 RepID=A0A8S3UYU1_MYTED|nr:unnamed protein product [Mytilus edulis]